MSCKGFRVHGLLYRHRVSLTSQCDEFSCYGNRHILIKNQEDVEERWIMKWGDKLYSLSILTIILSS